jgi:quercetin dioxygenase-like cupin family protein
VNRHLAVAALLLGLAAPLAGRAADEGVTVTPRFAHELANVPGQRLSAVEVTIAPGATPAPHHHAGSVYVYVLAGTIRLGLAGETPQLYHAGDSFFEPPGSTHAVSDNPSKTKPARLLAVFVAPDEAQLTAAGPAK